MNTRHWQRYSKDEDAIIKRHMLDVDKNIHKNVLRRCAWISENYLPDRTPEGIRQRWFSLIGKVQHLRKWGSDIKDVADLLSPDQRRRIRVSLPRFKKYVDPRVGKGKTS